MLRFLISLIILGGLAFGIYSFGNPLNQLAKNTENSGDEYENLLTEALQRNNPEAFGDEKNVSKKQDSELRSETLTKENETPTSSGSKINKAFSYNHYYSDPQNLEKNGREIPENKIQTVRTGSDLYIQDSGAKGFFGTPQPVIPRTQRDSKQAGGIIFNPPIVPPPLPTNDGPMMFGMFTKIRESGNNWSL